MIFKDTDKSLLYVKIKPKYMVIPTETLVLRKKWRCYCVQL
jgi:hypothetical protein